MGETIAIIETEENPDEISKSNLSLSGDKKMIQEIQDKPTSKEKELDLKNIKETPNIIEETEIQKSLEKIQNDIETAKDIVHHPKKFSSKKFYSPLVKSIAKKEGIETKELDSIVGTGKKNRVTKNDILNYLKTRVANTQFHNTASSQDNMMPKIKGNQDIIEMSRMRKLIADHMIMSKSVSAHVTSFNEVDMTNIVKWRNKIKEKFQNRENQKITFTPIIIESIIKAIIDFPMINISVKGTKIIKHKNINIGMATALTDGNLIVPVIKNGNEKNLLGLTKSVNDLSNRARNGNLKPDDTLDGTFTFTNVGTFGSVMGTPIINQPQVAILAAGVIQKKASVIETEHGDLIGVRSKMFLSLSYDHRVVDGALGGSFLKRIAYYLESFDTKREI